ncbi:hypothetical protein [Janibacter sp. GXQ6167]|uniref:hypothetical protein n=1 Tax=Janibacter sp. GXQ6167 TaxID=3240791 RepID=UPI0035261817
MARRGPRVALVLAGLIALSGCGEEPPPSPDPGTFSTTSRSSPTSAADGSDRAILLDGKPMASDSWKVATCDPDLTSARVPPSGKEPGIELRLQWSGDAATIPSLTLLMPKGSRVEQVRPGLSNATRSGEYVTVRSEVATSATSSKPLVYRFTCAQS